MRDNPVIITGPGTGSITSIKNSTKLRKLGGWNDYVPGTGRITITCVPALYNSGLVFFD